MHTGSLTNFVVFILCISFYVILRYLFTETMESNEVDQYIESIDREGSTAIQEDVIGTIEIEGNTADTAIQRNCDISDFHLEEVNFMLPDSRQDHPEVQGVPSHPNPPTPCNIPIPAPDPSEPGSDSDGNIDEDQLGLHYSDVEDFVLPIDTSSSGESDTDSEIDVDLTDDLAKWAMEHNISHAAISGLHKVKRHRGKISCIRRTAVSNF